MYEVAKVHQDRLKELKGYVEESHKYFEDNNKRFHEFMQFVFSSALNENDITKLQELQKPAIEFNILEAYISRQRGEFADHEPGMAVSMADGLMPSDLTPTLAKQVEVVEGHIRDIFDQAENDGFEDKIYNDLLSGGYSVAKVYTDYITELSFEQKICVERVFEPTLCGFDPMARESHKGDGRYAFEIIPCTKEDFELEFGKGAAKDIQFTRNSNVGGFNWSYLNGDQKVLLRVMLYEKKRKREKIAKLSNGKTILSKHYKQLEEIWEQAQRIEQMPIIIEERYTYIDTICRYQFCENKVLEYIETDYKFLPLIFIDGNSVMLKQKGNGTTQQMTRPYVYQAKGIQKLKNFAGQTVAAEMENMVQHKFMAAIESIPEDYREAYDNVQQAQVLVYNAFMDGNPEQPLPPPREIQRTPTPPIVQETFMGSDQVTQAILGSYDAQLGITDGNISGKAIQQGAMHSSAAAKPYLIGYIKGLNRIAQIILDLIPKYYVTPRTIPVRKSNGMRDYKVINQEGAQDAIKINYKPQDLQVKIEVGVNTQLQKQMALQQIIQLMGASEMFAKFINEDGLETLLENVDIRGIETLKIQAMAFMEKAKEAQQASAGQPPPEQQLIDAEKEIEGARIQQRREQAQGELSIKAAQLSIDKEKADMEFLRLLAEVESLDRKALHETRKFDAQMTKDAVGLAMDMSSHNAELAQDRGQNYGGTE